MNNDEALARAIQLSLADYSCSRRFTISPPLVEHGRTRTDITKFHDRFTRSSEPTYRKVLLPKKKKLEVKHKEPERIVVKKESNIDPERGVIKKGPEEKEEINPELRQLIEADIIQKRIDVSWDDIVGLDEAKKLIHESVVLPLIIPQFFTGIREPWKGILLFGPPGTGKTLLARVASVTTNTTFFNISVSSIMSKWLGESEKLIRKLFEIAREKAPSIIFMDEIDAIASSRSEGKHEASRRTLSELLSQMDGINSSLNKGLVMVLATTNKPWDLDEAIRRRLEKRIYIPLPSLECRIGLLKHYLSSLKLDPSISIEKLAQLTENYSCADIKNLCKDISMMPIRDINLLDKTPEEIRAIVTNADSIITTNMVEQSVRNMKATVSIDELSKYEQWNHDFGSF